MLENRNTALANRTTALEDRTTALADRTTALEDRTAALADRTTALEDRTTALADKTTALAAHNCDTLFNLNFRNDGAYNISIRGKILLVYCEFGRGGYNWLVSKQSILLYELEMKFFKINFSERKLH